MQFFPASMSGQQTMFDPAQMASAQTDSNTADFSTFLSSHLDDPVSVDAPASLTAGNPSDVSTAGPDADSATRAESDDALPAPPVNAVSSEQNGQSEADEPAKLAAEERDNLETGPSSDETQALASAAHGPDPETAGEVGSGQIVDAAVAGTDDEPSKEATDEVSALAERIENMRTLLAGILGRQGENQGADGHAENSGAQMRTIDDFLQRIDDALANGDSVFKNPGSGALTVLKDALGSFFRTMENLSGTDGFFESSDLRQFVKKFDGLKKELDRILGQGLETGTHLSRKGTREKSAGADAGDAAARARTVNTAVSAERAVMTHPTDVTFEAGKGEDVMAAEKGTATGDGYEKGAEQSHAVSSAGKLAEGMAEKPRATGVLAGVENEEQGHHAEEAGRKQGSQSAVSSVKDGGGAQDARQQQDARQVFFSGTRRDSADTARVFSSDSAKVDVTGDVGNHAPSAGLDVTQRVADTATRVRSADVYKQVENGAFKNIGQGTKQLVIRLDPEDLGQVTVVLQVRGKEVQATLRTTSQDASQALNEQLGQLRSQLENQGLKVGKLEVQTQLADSETQSGWQGAEHHNRYQENREFAMTAQRMRSLGRLDGGLVRDVQVGSYREKNASGGLDLFA